MAGPAAVLAAVADVVRKARAMRAQARGAQVAFKAAAAAQVPTRVAHTYRRGKQLVTTAGEVVDRVEMHARRAERVVMLPAAVAGEARETVTWFTAPVGEKRQTPRWLKWLVVVVVVLYIPFTLVHRLPDQKLIPGVPLMPSWGDVWGFVFPSFPAPGSQDAAYACQSEPSVQNAAAGVPGLPGAAAAPFLSTVAEATGKALAEDFADPDNIKAYWQWLYGTSRVVVGGVVTGLLGSGTEDASVQEYDAAAQQRFVEASALCGGAVTPGPLGAAPAAPAGLCPASGSSAERGLSPYALTVLRCGAATFPQLKSFGGVGARGNKSDHPSGHAVDLMIPAWQTPAGKALGSQVAAWYVANGEAMHAKYVIWDSRINTLDGRGWRPYVNPQCSTAFRCGSTLQHRDHVHVSVKAGPVT